MCGIFAVFNYPGDIKAYRQQAIFKSKKIRHRGPDWSGCIIADQHVFCHERLAIVGVASGAQPISNEDGSLILTINGEIYNHRELRKMLPKPVVFRTESDCEVILYLYEAYGDKCVEYLDGDFAFVLYDAKKNRIIAARDPIGVNPLYYGTVSASPKTIYFGSEMKALNDECDRVLAFPPGHIYSSDTNNITRWYDPTWWPETKVPQKPIDYAQLKESFEKAVKKRLMSEVPYGVLLSGGLDSSLVASVALRETEKIAKHQEGRKGNSSPKEDQQDDNWATWPRLHSFSIGLPGSPDLVAARTAAKFLGTVHHENTFTIQEGIDAVPDVIFHLETYDVTTVRASVPMFLLSRKIKAMGVKMVLSGEGSDEIFGGYLYFHSAPNSESLHEETVKRVKNLHTSDCLRANKSTMAWGLEARVPFLDKDFLDVAMSIDPKEKMCSRDKIEKYALRKAFDTSDDPNARPYLPDNILWRQKEQFSDGVGYSWINSLKDRSEILISDEKFETRAERWPRDTPKTKEAYWYREIFESWYAGDKCTESVVRWIPRADWNCPEDPSGRAQRVHEAAYDSSQLTTDYLNGNGPQH
jgi:asparagine synthase (glutamine-hydrolysing)